MANASVDGLISGLDTSSVISQLMQIEAQPQTRLKTQVSAEQKAVTALQSLNTALKSVTDKAKALDTASDWRVYSATSSSTNVAATATSSAAPGTFRFSVESLATPYTVLFDNAAAKDATVAGATIGISVNNANPPVSVAVGNGSLQSVVNGINAKTDLGVKAGLIKTDAGYRLQLTSTTTGSASHFTVTGLGGAGLTDLGAATPTSAGDDAVVLVGPDPVKDRMTSSTNTFTDVFPGVTFTVGKKETDVTLTVGTDTTTLQGSVKSLVDALNTALTQLASSTAYDPTTKSGGPLLGQLLPRQLQDSLRNAVFSTTGNGTLASVGIELNSSGKFDLDATKLADALKADTASVSSVVSAFATRVAKVAGKASGSGGTVSAVIDGRQSMIRTLNDRIDDWDTRLTDRRDVLKKQYAALETALGNLQSQGNWLAGQIGSLPTYGSN